MASAGENRRRPGIRTVLLALSLGVLALPIGSIVVLRIYESALVRQTETGLITQSAFVAALFREALFNEASMVVTRDDYGKSIPPGPTIDPVEESRWQPRPASLDLATSSILRPAPDTRVDGVADEIAFRAGMRLQKVLTEAQLTTLAGLRITDHQGVVVATTGNDLGHSMITISEVTEALRGAGTSHLRLRKNSYSQPQFSSISRGAGLRVYVSTPVMINNRVVGAVLAMRTPRTLGSALYANRKLLIALALGLLAVALLAGWLVSFAIVRPVKELRAQALRAVEGEPGAMEPLRSPVTRDIDQLSKAVSTMARSLEERANYVREFASHVSHEFKTPLTAMRGSIELLQDHGNSMSVDEQQHFLTNLDGDVRRLEKLVADLLQLTTRPQSEQQSGSVRDALNEISTGASGPRVTLSLPVGSDPLSAGMATSTMVSIFASVIDNAFEHGATAVDASAFEGNNSIVIQITDDGPGIDDANHERIFEAFYTTRESPTGHGLGLALVASLARSHGGSIRSLNADKGAHFEIRLPLVPLAT